MKTEATRTNSALRRVRIAIREGKVPAVKQTRDAIIHCARTVEMYGDAGAAIEAMALAPYAVSRKVGN